MLMPVVRFGDPRIREGLLFWLIGLAACGNPPLPVEPAPCTPGYIVVFGEPETVEVGFWAVTFNVALVGCSELLESVSQQEWLSIRALLKERVATDFVTLFASHEDGGFRSRVTEVVNADLGRDVVDDVLFHDVGFRDHQ